MYQGRTFLCQRLDIGARVATVRSVDVKYYTTPVKTLGEIRLAMQCKHGRW